MDSPVSMALQSGSNYTADSVGQSITASPVQPRVVSIVTGLVTSTTQATAGTSGNLSALREQRGPDFGEVHLPTAAGGNSALQGLAVAAQALLLLFIFLLSSLGNSAVVVVIIKHRQLRTVTNAFIMSLSLSDFLTAVLCLPFSFIMLFSKDGVWMFGDAFCAANGFFNTCFGIISTLTMTLISIERLPPGADLVRSSQTRVLPLHVRVPPRQLWRRHGVQRLPDRRLLPAAVLPHVLLPLQHLQSSPALRDPSPARHHLRLPAALLQRDENSHHGSDHDRVHHLLLGPVLSDGPGHGHRELQVQPGHGHRGHLAGLGKRGHQPPDLRPQEPQHLHAAGPQPTGGIQDQKHCSLPVQPEPEPRGPAEPGGEDQGPLREPSRAQQQPAVDFQSWENGSVGGRRGGYVGLQESGRVLLQGRPA